MKKLGLAVIGAVLLGAGLCWLGAGRERPEERPRAAAPAESAAATLALAPPTVDDGARRPIAEGSVEAAVEVAEESTPPQASHAGDAGFFGLVLDGLSGLPIAGALAQLKNGKFEFEQGLPVRLDGARVEARSQADGLFRFDYEEAGRRGFVFLSRDGYGTQSFFLEPGHETSASARVFELLPAASLELWVHDPSGSPQAGLEVCLSDANGLRVVLPTQPLRSTPFAREHPLLETTGADGRARFANVPAEVAFELSVENGDRTRLALAPREHRTVECVRGFARVSGLVLDPDEKPVARHPLALSATRTMDEDAAWARVQATGSTDDLGRFAFSAVPYGTWRLATDGASDARGSCAELVLVDRAKVAVELRLAAGIPIAGRVVREDGGEFDETFGIHARSVTAPHRAADTSVDEHGGFRFAALMPGAYELQVWGVDSGAAPLRVEAGTEDVELCIPIPRLVTVHLSGAAGEIQAKVTDRHRVDRGWFATWTRDGFLETLLGPGSYTLTFTTTDDRIGVATAEIETSPPPEIRVSLELGARLTVVQNASATASTLCLRSGDALFLDVPLIHGESAVQLVPAGEVVAELRDEERILARESVHLVAGERRRLVLEAR